VRSGVCFRVPAKSTSLVQAYPKRFQQNCYCWYTARVRNVLSVTQMAFVGGHPALDFVNTAEERADPEADDALRSAADLRAWGQRYGLIARSARRSAADEAEFELAREARELLYALFHARAHGHRVPKDGLARLAELAAAAYGAATLAPNADGSVHWRWDRAELSTIRHVAVTSALELLSAASAGRLKQCPGEHCGWFFLDATKRGNRRWCSMSECGQEAKNVKRRLAPRRGGSAAARSAGTSSARRTR
jgi:predicted RNA-binding Zn ribbon-like protein